jgi:hypothetical protein
VRVGVGVRVRVGVRVGVRVRVGFVKVALSQTHTTNESGNSEKTTRIEHTSSPKW